MRRGRAGRRDQDQEGNANLVAGNSRSPRVSVATPHQDGQGVDLRDAATGLLTETVRISLE